jgi:zinc/manganese transport system substrate-binding protein/manganese/iron transport system substrate-binding protein
MPTVVVTALALLAAALVALGREAGGAAGARVTVVATTTQAADLARNVGGDGVEVVGLLAPNADPHEYEVRPRDLHRLADADLVVRSGGDLDEWLQEAIEGSGAEAPVITLLDAVRAEGDDPHGERVADPFELAEAEQARAGTARNLRQRQPRVHRSGRSDEVALELGDLPPQ